MEQAIRALVGMQSLEPARSRASAASSPIELVLEVNDPEVLVELRRHDPGGERERYALAALRVGVLALRAANGQVDAAAIREAGHALVGEVRDLMSSRATETTERIASALMLYLDPQNGVLPQRLQALVREDGELERLLQAHVGGDDSVLARSLAAHLGEGSPLFKLLSPTESNGLRAQLGKTIADALADQRVQILREFSLDSKDSALSRLFSEFSLDDETSVLSRLSRMLMATSEQIGKSLTLDDETSALARLRRELFGIIDELVKSNVEFQAQVREALARLDTRRKHDATTPRHGVTFEERLGALLADEAQRLGDLYSATGDTTGAIKQCKKGDHVIELAPDSAAAHAQIVWEAKEKNGFSLRAALDEIEDARRNRRAQVGVFVFSRRTAPEGVESLQRYGSDVVVVWDADDPASDVTVRAAYSLARALAVRERRNDRESTALVSEIERAARGIERQVGQLAEIRRWAETVKGHGEKIADRSARAAEQLCDDVRTLDGLVAAIRSPNEWT